MVKQKRLRKHKSYITNINEQPLRNLKSHSEHHAQGCWCGWFILSHKSSFGRLASAGNIN